MAGVLLALCAGCPPPGAMRSAPAAPPQPEQEDIVPVGGYEVLAGLWTTTRSEGGRERPLRLQIQVTGQRLTGAAPPVSSGETEHAVRIECEVMHRTCLGTWYDNDGRGNLTWRFGTDFASFRGSYQGQRRGAFIEGAPAWSGRLRQR